MINDRSKLDGTLTITTDDGWSVSVEYATVDVDPWAPRDVWHWRIVGPVPFAPHDGVDLTTVSRGSGGELAAMRALGSFLSAYVEAEDHPHSDNRNLFPGLPHEIADDLALTIYFALGEES